MRSNLLDRPYLSAVILRGLYQCRSRKQKPRVALRGLAAWTASFTKTFSGGNKLEIETGQSALFSGLGFNSPDLGTSLKERKKERKDQHSFASIKVLKYIVFR